LNTVIHFLDVGQGNMVLIEASDGSFYICDCNITAQNEDAIIGYLGSVIGWETEISAFICTHRDADHMRGVNKINDYFPIQQVWDSGYPGTTTDSTEYKQYMSLRRSVISREKKSMTRSDYGLTRFRYFSAIDSRLAANANAQGLVLKIEQRTASGSVGSSVLLTGDCDAETWRHGILQDYSENDVKASILMAAHHGSITFF
jgi:beta-lactamase superfamily II metal-dependent hydrolase